MYITTKKAYEPLMSRSNQIFERDPPYRSQEAQDLHTAIIGYIHSPGVNGVRDRHLQRVLSTCSPAALMEVSCNGYTHMQDVLHLPYKIHQDKALAQNISLYLFNVLKMHCRSLPNFVDYADCIKLFLFSRTLNGFTPLHEILKFGNANNVRALFDTLQQLRDEGILTTEKYSQLLTSICLGGCTPLHQAIKSGQSENVRIYLSALRLACEQGIISRELFAHVWVTPCLDGYTSLHQALKLGNEGVVREYFAALELALNLNLLSYETYSRLVVEANMDGYNPLHDALFAANPNNLRLYNHIVQDAWMDGIISNEANRSLLVSQTVNGLSTLHLALKSRRQDVIIVYFLMLERAHANRIISNDDYREILISSTQASCSALHYAIKSYDVNVVTAYTQQLKTAIQQNLLSRTDYGSILKAHSLSGYNILHEAASSGSIEMLGCIFHELEIELPRHEVYALLTERCSRGNQPECPADNEQAVLINDFLNQRRREFAPVELRYANSRQAFIPNMPRVTGEKRKTYDDQIVDRNGTNNAYVPTFTVIISSNVR